MTMTNVEGICADDLLLNNLDTIKNMTPGGQKPYGKDDDIGDSHWRVVRDVNMVNKYRNFLPIDSDKKLKFSALRLMTDSGKKGEVRYDFPDGLCAGSYTAEWIDALYSYDNVNKHTDINDAYTIYLSNGATTIWETTYRAQDKTLLPSWSEKRKDFILKSDLAGCYLGLRGETNATIPSRACGCLISQISLTLKGQPDPVTERLILLPKPSDLTAATGGTLCQPGAITVIVERLTDGEWQVTPSASISATLLNSRDSAPYFITAESDKHHFSAKMAGKFPVSLPAIRAGVQTGTYELHISVTQQPKVFKTVQLQVIGVERFEPETFQDEVSRKWTTESGRWSVKACLKDGAPAPDQPVDYLISAPQNIDVKFEAGGTKLSGKTDKYGYARIPAIVVPDQGNASFKVYIIAGNSGAQQAQAQVNITIEVIQPAGKVEKAGWEDGDTVSVLSPKSFSVLLKDHSGKKITSGKHAVFMITNNSAGAGFRSPRLPAGSVADHADMTRDIVPACLDGGLARLTSREIECTTVGGMFTLTVMAQEDSGFSTSGNISVTSERK